jgi:lysozyme family protein
MIEKITEERETFYKGLKHFDTFGKGWLRRNEETKSEAIKLAEEKQIEK